MTDLLAALPLRERKRARVRVGLWRHLRDRVERVPFAEISVKELAAAVEVSEPTFFTHFPSKNDLLGYHICLWRIGCVLASPGTGGDFVRRFFAATAQSILDGPRLWFEITAEIARGGGLCAVQEVSAAERLMVFDDPAALDVEITPQADLFANHLAQVPGLDVPAAVTALLTGFYGVPLALGEGRLDELADAYREHVDRVLTV
ncbi:hypothetical protein [Alloactinosynnema sp. L-07]|uniref:TetR/AcrR family transcriptional regulator n=1 Tax=Alloactinosynnema sp. L-07 TaxID=1653480 RepID=UPI00065EF47B|nr:TetR family transcriptional regulator [Alloactinosynnema sp. L-07]CRK61845.1 hypothetical protein [Alloactinosynnema sp. L-07]